LLHFRRVLANLHSHTYTVFVKNITLNVDEKVLAAARRLAAERNSTVNALVREYLTNLAMHEDRAGRARARLTQLSERSKGRLGKKTWTRAGLHER
jgi:cysteinyl-tRNA synthetase